MEAFLAEMATLPSKGWKFFLEDSHGRRLIRATKDGVETNHGGGFCPVCAAASERGINPKGIQLLFYVFREDLGLTQHEADLIVDAADGDLFNVPALDVRGRMLAALNLEELP
jgi:hypothetical protein